MIPKIAFTHYCVSDMNRALEFYQDVLGLKLELKEGEWSEFLVGGQRLALYLKEDGIEKSGGAVVWFHADPIEQTVSELKNRGALFDQDVREFPYGKTATFLDPDGNLLGLYQPPK